MNNTTKTQKKGYLSFLIHTISILFISFFLFNYASAATYYIDSSITDTNVSSATPDCTNYNPSTYLCSGGTASAYKTLSDVNAKSYSPGDFILFKKGDTFYGFITISQSGTSGNSITFSSYGSGNKPIITGFTDVTSWTSLGNNIWESTNQVSQLPTLNMVTVNGVNTAMGRYPNADATWGGYLKIDSHVGKTSLTSSSLTSATDWIGAEAVIRSSRWTLERRIISSYSSGTLTYTTPISYTPTDGYGFFIQNDPRTLDQQNEWYYNPTTHKLQIYNTSEPTGVKVASVDNLITIAGNYITFDSITFTGTNINGFYNDTAIVRSNITINNSEISFIGRFAVSMKTNYLTIENNDINNSNATAISIPNCNYATISNNIIQNIGLLNGMIYAFDSLSGISSDGSSNLLIEYNIIKNIGYNGIGIYGNSNIIRNNFIDSFCFTVDDGSGIYTFTGNRPRMTGMTISDNIVINGIGAWYGTNTNTSSANGIYLDDNSKNVEVGHNSVANITSLGIFLHNTSYSNIHDNNVFNSYEDIVLKEDLNGNDYVEYNDLHHNIFIGNSTFGDIAEYRSTLGTSINHGGTFDYNYYISYHAPTTPIRVNTSIIGSVSRTLSYWQTYSGQDSNSYLSPITINNFSDIFFDYNATTQNKTVSLGSSSYMDVTGATYSGSITLLPYTSIVLIKRGTVQGVSTYNFTLTLKYGSNGNEVKELQKILISDGYLTGKADGIFGTLTQSAVKDYQKANALTPDGVIGSLTREILNK